MRATVLQVAHGKLFATYRDAVRAIQVFSQLHGYEYRQVQLADSVPQRFARNASCAYTWKVEHILRELRGPSLREGDWLLFVDADVTPAEDSALGDDLRALLPTNSSDSEPCFLIAQDGRRELNTGVLLLRKSADAIEVVADWLARQKEYEICRFGADQIALQFVLTAWIARRLGAQPPLRCPAQPLPRPSSLQPGHYSRLDECYVNAMATLQMPHNKRSRAGVCLIPTTTPLNIHDFWRTHRPGSFFYHGKRASSKAARWLTRRRALLSQGGRLSPPRVGCCPLPPQDCRDCLGR